MSATELWVMNYVLNALWQAPAIFGAAWLSSRIVGQMSVRVVHRIWVSALVLEAVMPACGQWPKELGREVWAIFQHGWSGAAGGHVRVAMGAGVAAGGGVLRLPAAVRVGIVAFYGGSLLYFAVRLGWGLWRTHVVREEAKDLELIGETGLSWRRYGRVFGVDGAEVVVSPMISGPVTVGVRRGVMMVPPQFLLNVSASDFDAVAAHELAHIRRKDFAKNVMYELLSLPIAFHPVMWLTRSRVAESREMVCDAMAAEAVGGRENYARSLLRLASMMTNGTPARTLHAIGIFDANIFERRVMNLTKRRVEVGVMRRFAIAAVCVGIGVTTCASAMAMRMEVSEQAQAKQPTGPQRVSAGTLAKMAISRPAPVYPEKAKADKIEGSVVLALIINKDGVPTEIAVKKGLREDVNESAVNAVKQWRWQPYVLNGEKTEVQSVVTVNYSLTK